MQGEVHNRLEVRVEAILVHIITLPICELRNRRGPHLTNNIEVGVLRHNGLAPLAHRHLLVVGVCIHAETIQIGVLDPPYSPLLEVVEQILVVEIHIGHRAVKPSALHLIEVRLRGVEIHICRECPVRLRIFRPLVGPIREGLVLIPPMRRRAMVGNDVHNNLQTAVVALLDILLEELVATEAWVYEVVVAARVAVVRRAILVVEQQRC